MAITRTLRGTPDELRTASQNFANVGSEIGNITNQMSSLVQGLSSAYQGEAATAYITKFGQMSDDIQRMIRMVSEHSEDLQQMANTYAQAETGVREGIDLADDVII